MTNNPQPSQSKGKFTAKVLAAIAFVGVLVGLAVNARQLVDYTGITAKRPQFFCDKDVDGAPITAFTHPNRGDVIIIRWASSYFKESGFDPQRRCQEVSARFQQYREQGKLQYITTGRKNGSNIVCVTEADQSPCLNDKDQGQLWTLKPESNPNEVLAALKSIRAGSDKAKVLVESQQTWVKVDDLLANNPTKPIF
jgi:hypothetical protein